MLAKNDIGSCSNNEQGNIVKYGADRIEVESIKNRSRIDHPMIRKR